MRLLHRKPAPVEAPPEVDLLPGVPEAGLGRCKSCGRSWKRVHGHATPYEEGRSCFPLCEECWAKYTPEDRLPYYSMLIADWRAQLGPYGEESWPAIRAAVLEGL